MGALLASGSWRRASAATGAERSPLVSVKSRGRGRVRALRSQTRRASLDTPRLRHAAAKAAQGALSLHACHTGPCMDWGGARVPFDRR